MYIRLPEFVYHNRFYRYHPLEVSNTIRVAMAIFAVAALSLAFGASFPLLITANIIQICQATAAISILVALALRFRKTVKDVILEECDYRYFNLSQAERLVINVKGVFGNIADTLAGIPTLDTLKMNNGALEKEHIARLAELTQVEEFSLEKNPLDIEGWGALGEALSQMSSLKTLWLFDCAIGKNELEALTQKLTLPHLKTLNILSEGIENDAVLPFSHFLSNLGSLSLLCVDKELSKTSVQILRNACDRINKGRDSENALELHFT